jgi:hypothetical protein
VTEYTRHGCNFTGNLAMIDLGEATKGHRDYGKFGANVWGIVSQESKSFMRQTQPRHAVLLTIPDLVVRLPEEGEQ